MREGMMPMIARAAAVAGTAILLMSAAMRHPSAIDGAARNAMPVPAAGLCGGEAMRQDSLPAWLRGYWSGIAYDHFDSAAQCPFQATILATSGGPRITYYRTEDYYCYRLRLLSANDSSAIFDETRFGYSFGKLRRIRGTFLYIERGADSGKAGGYYYSGRLDRTTAHFEMSLIPADQGIHDQCRDQW